MQPSYLALNCIQRVQAVASKICDLEDVESSDDGSDDGTLLKPMLEPKQETYATEQDLFKPKQDQVDQAELATPLSTFADGIINIESDDDDMASNLDLESFLQDQTQLMHGFDLEETKQLKVTQDMVYQESLFKDQEKAKEAKNQAMADSLEKIEHEKLQQTHLLRVPEEQQIQKM